MNKQVLLQCLTLHKVLRSEMGPTAWKMPSASDCIRYAAQEAAEVCDAEMRAKRNHARNNERDGDLEAVARECADVIIMAHSALMQMDWEPSSHPAPFDDEVKEYFAWSRRELQKDNDEVLWSDYLITSAGSALENFFIGNDEEDSYLYPAKDFSKVLLLGAIVHAMVVMESTGHNPLTQVYKKCVDFATKHGERYREGYGLAVVDKLTEYYDAYMKIQSEWGN